MKKKMIIIYLFINTKYILLFKVKSLLQFMIIQNIYNLSDTNLYIN